MAEWHTSSLLFLYLIVASNIAILPPERKQKYRYD